MLTEQQIQEFCSTKINNNTFILVSKLIMLNNLESFRYIIELLYYEKINYFDLDYLPSINDTEITKFINYYNSLNNLIVASDIHGDFDSHTYLKLTDITSPVMQLLIEYNRSRNSQFELNQFKNIKALPVFNVCIKNKTGCYQSVDMFKSEYNSKVISSLSSFNIYNELPLQYVTDNLNISDDYKLSLQEIYLSLFSTELLSYIHDMNNNHRILINLNDDESLRFSEFKKLSELVNFSYFSPNLSNVHNTTLNNINTLGRSFNNDEILALKNDIISFKFTDYKNSEAFTELVYHIRLLKIVMLNNNLNIDELNLYETELFKIANKTIVLQTYLNSMQTLIINNIKLTDY